MTFNAILAPLFVQVALTFMLLGWMGVLRVRNVTSGAVHPRDIALGQATWPEQAILVANAYHNQLQLPLLYYLLAVLALVVAPDTPGLVVLSWLFVASRLIHALIHVTTNNIPRRFFAFSAGTVILLVMWAVFFVEIAFGS